MTIIYNLQELSPPLQNPVLTIGNFDGVHRGHLALFEKVKERASALTGQSSVMTFHPHPLKVLRPEKAPPVLTPLDQRIHLIQEAGIDVIFCLPFTPEFSKTSAKDFVSEALVQRIGVREVVVGHDYRFGFQGQGNIRILRQLGDKLGFQVTLVGPVRVGDQLVSSTHIRRLLLKGHLREANEFLGRIYEIQGTVVQGHNRGGRLLGYPTANLRPGDQLIPKTGVYVSRVFLGDSVYDGVTNVGYNPTFGNGEITVETHLLDFSDDLVGKTIGLRFIDRLRGEKAFSSILELSRQIADDVEEARALFKKMEKSLDKSL